MYLLALIGGQAAAQEVPEETWQPLVMVRPRFSTGFTEGIALGVLTDRAVTHRARLGLAYSRGVASAQVVTQLASGWNCVDAAAIDTGCDYTFVPPGVDFFEGWGRLQGDLVGKLEGQVTAGRLAITLHDGRLISTDDFSWDGQPIDGVHASWGLGNFHWNVLTYRNPDPNPRRFRGAASTWLGFGHANALHDWTFDWTAVTDFLGEDVRVTVGPFFSWQKGRLHLQTEMYVQSVLSGGADAPISGLASQVVGVTLGPERLAVFKVRGDVSAGDLNGSENGFTAPLGDSYRFFGHLGLFQNAASTAGRGVGDLALLSSISVHPRLVFETDLHQISFLDSGSAGQELDVLARYHVSPFARVEVGVSSFFSSEASRAAYELSPIESTQYFQLEVGAPAAR